MRVLVFGDSISYGAWDTQGGWVERLKTDAHIQTVKTSNQFKRQVMNLSVGGHSSSEIVARLENEIIARHSNSWPFALIFSYGTNDERMHENTLQTSIDQFKQNTERIIQIARKYSNIILFVGAPPLPVSEIVFKRHIYNDERVKIYDQLTQAIVEAAGIPFVPIRETFEKYDLSELFNITDDPHPNDKGHVLIFKAVKPVLDKLLEQ